MVDLVVLVLDHLSYVKLSITDFANVSSLQSLALWEWLCLVSATGAESFGAKLAIFYVLKVFVWVIAACAFTTLALLSYGLWTRQFKNGVIVKVFKEHMLGWRDFDYKVLILLSQLFYEIIHLFHIGETS